jgi:hypothetical protein
MLTAECYLPKKYIPLLSGEEERDQKRYLLWDWFAFYGAQPG